MGTIREWKPISRQQEIFLSLPDTIKEAFFGGSAGPGKSECLMMYPIVRGFIKLPRFKALFLRRTYKELEREIIPRSRELYEAFGGKLNKTSLSWEFESGATIWFGHCENEKDVTTYDSMEINLFLPDELQSFLEYMYLYIGFTRVRTSHPNLPAIIRAAGMPGGVGHSWVKKRFVDPNPNGGVRLVSRNGNERIYIKSTVVDNPKVSKDYAKGLEELPESEKRAKRYGDWTAYEGQVFEEFREKHYPGEPDHAVHIIEPFIIPDWWPRIVSIDWGFKAMCSVGWAAISPNRRVYVYRHQIFVKKKITEWAPEVRYYIDLERPADVIICHSASQNRGDPHTVLEQVEEELNCGVRLGERDRVGGKMLLHEYLRWNPKGLVPRSEIEIYDDERAQWLLRNQGVEAFKNYFKTFMPQEEESNLPKLQLFRDPLIDLIGESIRACVYEKETKEGKKKEDVAEFSGDDPYDMLRMLLHAADAFFNLASDQLKKVEKINKVHRHFEETGDVTTFYRMMKKLEKSDNSDSASPVSRYHGNSHYLRH